MNGAEVLDVGRDAIWLTLQLSAPVLIVGLIVGVGIGLFQALTQIQDQGLPTAVKFFAVLFVLFLTYVSTSTGIAAYAISLFALIETI